MTTKSANTLASSLSEVKLSHGPQIPLKQTKPVADSWEDDSSSETETESSTTSPGKTGAPGPPPPTPASPTFKSRETAFQSPYQTMPPYGMTSSDDSKSPRRSMPADSDKRPEKTTSTASRLIAAGLGQKAPRRTKEEREYDQAMKLQAKKKRDAAKAEEERKKKELDKARQAIWED